MPELDRGSYPIQPVPVRQLSECQAAGAQSPVVETNFLCDLAILDAEHSRAREPHLPARRRRERTDKKIAEGGSGVSAAAFPAPTT